MHKSVLFFKVSDYVNHPLRNYKKYNDITRVNDIVYDESIGKYGKLDIYFDKSLINDGEKFPVFVNIHGGGFVRGDKKFRSGICSLIASYGFFVVNVNYSLAPMATFPQATIDCLHALDKLPALANEYPIDLDRVVISGDSAGGFYATHTMLAIYNEEMRKALKLPEISIKKLRAVLTFCAPFNMAKCLDTKAPLNMNEDIAKCVFGKDFDLKKKEAFVEFTESNCLRYFKPGLPEFFIVAATNDIFCGGQLDGAKAKLDECGIKYDFYEANVKGDSHCTHLLPFKKGTEPTMNAVKKYLDTIRGEGNELVQKTVSKKRSPAKRKKD